LDKTGGLNYLTELTNAAVTSANTKMYVNVIKDKALMRQMIDAAEKIAADGFEGQTDIDEYLDGAEKSILNVSRNRKAGNFKTSTELMTNVLNEISKMSENKSDITGLKTGLNDLDHMTHGLQRGDMLVLAARPSMGKTAVGLNLAMNVAAYQRKGAVAIFSLEMAAEQLAMRLLSAKSHVPADKLKTGRLSNDEWNQINEAAGELKSEQIYIDDASIVKVPEIFSKCRKLQAEHGLNLIMIDYIQLIAGSSRNSEANRQQEVSDISRSLKALARELQVPVLALSQLSRTVEQREKKQPMLSDLRESGAIEQDADIVMMLYRESYYDEAAKEKANQTGSERLEINLAKHRNGSTGKINVAFEAATNAIYNIENSQDYSQE
jgi:replicative DNA helicase